ncbi:MAG: hypothetical protein KC431_26905 [Myxococcales bacterium]|nr:hypothetical protein [Myxococcales bacterium]
MDPRSDRRWCAEVMAFAFGDLLVDAVHLDPHGRASTYLVGEGKAARLLVDEEALPDPRAFALLRAEHGYCELAITPAMRGVVIDSDGRGERQSLARRLAEAGADDEGVRRFELLPDEQVWIALGSLRLRVRLVPREAMVTSPQPLDRPWLASLLSCAVVAMAVLALLRAQPAPAAYELERDDDERRAAVARLLPEPPLDSEEDEPVEESTPDARHGTERTPRPSRRPEPRPSTSTRPRHETPRWVPANAAAAVGHMGRNYDPMAAARQAGVLGIIGDRRLAGDTVFDQAIDDHQLWAATSSEPTMPDWLLGGPSIDTRRPGDQLIGLQHDLIGYGNYGDLSVSARAAGFASRGGFDPRWKKQWQPPPKLGLHVTAGLDVDVAPARRVFRQHIRELIACKAQYAKYKRGAVIIDLSITRGRTGPVLVRAPQGEVLAGCVRNLVQGWQFPLSQQDGTHLVHVEIRFPE